MTTRSKEISSLKKENKNLIKANMELLQEVERLHNELLNTRRIQQ